MTYPEVLANARECIGKYCKACPVCNGVACKNQIPGPGAKGVGDTAIRNYNKAWTMVLVLAIFCRFFVLRVVPVVPTLRTDVAAHSDVISDTSCPELSEPHSNSR